MLINGIEVNNTAGPTSFTGVSQCPLLDLHGKGFAQQAVRFHGLDPCGPPIVSLQFRAKPGPLGTMPSRPCPAHTGTHHMLQATDSRSLKALEPRVDQREASEATRKDPQLMSVLVFFPLILGIFFWPCQMTRDNMLALIIQCDWGDLHLPEPSHLGNGSKR